MDLSGSITESKYTFNLITLDELDLEAIDSIEQRCHSHPWSRSALHSSLVNHYCVGLRTGDSYAGYAVLSFAVGQAELLLFVLDTPWRGRGIAKAFLQQLLNASSERAQTMFLEVRESNHNAIALYEALGFNQVGLRPNYYPRSSHNKAENALIYAAELV